MIEVEIADFPVGMKMTKLRLSIAQLSVEFVKMKTICKMRAFG
jgi:hypothetical protein